MPEITIIIPGSVRSKKNSKRVVMIGGKNVPRRPMVLPSKASNEWARDAWTAAKAAMKRDGACMIMKPLEIEVSATFFVRGPAPDLSGALESLGDALENVVYENDGQIVSWDDSRVYRDKDNPRTLVVVRW